MNACYDRPGCLALLADVAEKHVFDAAYGLGHYDAKLVRCGTQVIEVRP